MEINKNNFIVIMGDNNVKSNMADSRVAIQERADEDGKPGKVEKFIDGKGNVNQFAENFIREGFDPSKIIINGQPATDVLQLNNKKMKEIKRSEARIGTFGYQRIGKFSDDEVAEMNKNKTLPDGKYIVYTPKINHYMDGMFTGTTAAQVQVFKAKDSDLEKWNKRGVKYTNKLPGQYEIVNDNGRTYIKEKNTDIKEAKKDLKKYLTIWGSALAGTFAVAAGFLLKARGK